MKSYIAPLLGVALLVGACSKADDTVNVQQLNQQFISAWNNQNAAQIDSLLAPDVQFVQGSTHFKGKEEVAAKWVRETLTTITDLKTNVVSSETDSKIAYEAGTFSVDVLPVDPAQPHAYGEGNFLLLWKKNAAGSWRLSYAQLEDLPVQLRN